jgi:hypothetical protein
MYNFYKREAERVHARRCTRKASDDRPSRADTALFQFDRALSHFSLFFYLDFLSLDVGDNTVLKSTVVLYSPNKIKELHVIFVA